MQEFVTGVTGIVSGIFTALVDALGSVGNLIFRIGEGGAISGVTGFGWVLILMISVPLATWLFGKLFSWLKSVGRAGR